MARTKYLITLDSEDGPFLTSPLGGIIAFDHYDDAHKAALRGPAGSKRWIHYTMPLAVYSAKANVVVVEEAASDSLAD